MPSYVVKPDRDMDLYVIWSTVVEAPVAWGKRDEIRQYLESENPQKSAASRLDRADTAGTSALWPSVDRPVYGWDDTGLLYQQEGILPRDRLAEACRRLGEDDGADLSDLLQPFEDGEA